MAVVLDVNVLPRGSISRTRKLRDAFMETYLASHPGSSRIAVDLASMHHELPTSDEWDISAKFEMLYGEGKLDEKQATHWNALSKYTDQLHMANLVVVSAPMWNFGIPWHLKRWIDAVVQSRLTFEIRDAHFKGLLEGRPAVVLTTRDSSFAPGTPYAPMDHHMPYLRLILGLIGLGPIHEVVAEPMMALGVQAGVAALEEACARARTLAKGL